ncbi:MAG: amidohydrolase family protein, partial [Gemmatimonadota bacterium]
HRSEDILNALQLAEEFSFKLILEGATEAHLVAKEIADAEVLVVVGAVARSSVRRDDLFRRGTGDIGALLSDAGVRWIPGSGAENGASARFVTLNAQLAFAGIRKSEPLRAVTAGAAHALGVANCIGSLRPGLLADFVLWSGDPLDPETKVVQVYVGGSVVYDAAEDVEKGARE